ncbi:MAG: DUF3800 domain-containing protein [Treponema sp.]|jgi:hypothetical protein|nr:DUF3800 domain-containing protein [Treponema sp.]
MKTEQDKETLLAFVDEIGDRGYSKKSSEYFAMAAVIFPVSVQQKVKDCIASIKTKMGISLKMPLHWYKHCRMHEDRKFITGEIAKLEGVNVIYVISDKKTTPKDHAMFYNTVAALTLERILKHSEKINKKVRVWFGHVRGFNHSTTIDYFNKWDWRKVNYNNLLEQPKWIPADTNSGIQLADQYAGILGAAMIADKHGNFEPSYLENIQHQIRKSEQGKINGYGIKAISADNDSQSFKWWPQGWS